MSMVLLEVEEIVRELIKALQGLHENMEELGRLVQKLRQKIGHERTERGRESRRHEQEAGLSHRMLSSLQLLVVNLESQLEKAEKAANRQGVKYYLAKLGSSILGADEMGCIATSMERELCSWLNLRETERLMKAIAINSINGRYSSECERAVSRIAEILRKGYDPRVQELIISRRLVEALVSLLEPLTAVPPSTRREAVLAVDAVVHFNKDIFLGLVLLRNVVERLLQSLSTCGQDIDLSLAAMHVLSRLTSAGKSVVVDEIQSKGGVMKIVEALDVKSQAHRIAAMECVLQMAYHGRKGAVDTMLEHDVLRRLARMEQEGGETPRGTTPSNRGGLLIEGDQLGLAHGIDHVKDHISVGPYEKPPFANAVAMFSLNLGIGTGLSQRQKNALKQEVLRTIKEVMPNETEAANITAEVLWAP